MLEVYKQISRAITRAERKGDRLYLYSDAYRYRLELKREDILRVTVTAQDDFSEEKSPGVICETLYSHWTYEQTADKITLQTGAIQVSVDTKTGAFTYRDGAGELLLEERNKDVRSLEKFTSYRLAGEQGLRRESIETADGKKEVIREAQRIEDETLYHTRLWLTFQDGEVLYGLGQHEEGFGNLRGRTVYVHQANRKIAIPLLVSSRGYGILVDTYSPMVFSDTDAGSYLYTEADREMDHYFIAGGTPDGVIKGYRFLTGKAAMLPKWAFGYLQSQERYETQEEILEIAQGYRQRGLGLDAVILDWCSWEDGKWGQKSFDKERFPDPRRMTDALHAKDVHFMMSVWPNMDERCEDHQEFQKAGLFLPGSNVYHALAPEGRKLYWRQLERALFSQGVDGWWCDSSEPFTPEWNVMCRPEPAKLYADFCREMGDRLPWRLANAYAYYHAMGIYEGQRSTQTDKRVCNLTRSAYTGQQRFGTILWSGDTSASWDTLRRQIGAGLMFSASGLPYWTADIGAFFVKKGEQWYWDGDYPQALTDLGYQELYVRWFQWGAFLPVFRAHGTDCRREMWQFDDTVTIEGEKTFYGALCEMNRLRYRLMPYLYATAGAVYLEDASFIRHLGIAFPEDETARRISDAYLFGDSILVCPVTRPMYYEAGNVPLAESDREREVYLPGEMGWYDFWTNRYYEGGQWIRVQAPIDKIPLFVREGALLPMTDVSESTAGSPDITVMVYAGRDGRFALYEDEGDGYGYESGAYCVRSLIWREDTREFCVADAGGDAGAPYLAKIKGYKVIHKEDF